ncbi:MAG TPA: 3-hydroxyacyl-CoA dehydrogenase family protein [Paludibacter sp.]|nr:3-hydroxyacyl-CoA dehydrogenase family protein [Paludibacter sp.]HOS44972.1 3-hydroxyacyl-CoA dehydrogenase family protein [Paludibacter sp.]
MAKTTTEPIERYGLSKRNRRKTLFSNIGVVGCGNEGSEIATTAAIHGMEVVFLEPNQEKIANAFSRIESKLDEKITNWGLTENEKKIILSRITGTTSYVDFQHCDFVIEVIRYNDHTGERQINARKEVFRQLEQVLEPTAIIASNVATVMMTELASELKYQERCIGMHFMINIPGSQILEIVPSLYTSQETLEKVSKFAKLINHEYINVMESSGLVSVRLFLTQLNEACQILMEGVSTVEDIDKVLTVGYGHSLGVFRTADKMGIEKIVKLLNNLYDEYGNIKYKPSPVLLRKVRAKNYGVSTGKGFYVYDESGNVVK